MLLDDEVDLRMGDIDKDCALCGDSCVTTQDSYWNRRSDRYLV